MYTNFKSKTNFRNPSIIKDGTHLVTICEVTEDLASSSNLWIDRTPQLKIKFKSKEAFISQWINLLGYMTKEDLSSNVPSHIVFKQHPVSKEWFAVDSRCAKRVENPIKTEICHAIIERVANCAGIIGEFNLEDLNGKKLYVTVRGGKVTHTHTIDEIEGVRKAA